MEQTTIEGTREGTRPWTPLTRVEQTVHEGKRRTEEEMWIEQLKPEWNKAQVKSRLPVSAMEEKEGIGVEGGVEEKREQSNEGRRWRLNELAPSQLTMPGPKTHRGPRRRRRIVSYRHSRHEGGQDG
jgi:hypothetical protein